MTDWQVGDGREEAVARHVESHVRAGDLDGVIRAIDEFAYQQSFLINVGDEKGKILDAAIQKARPKRVVELGAYVGYSALRIARQLAPGAHLYSIEFNADNAAITRRVLKHAGVQDRVTVIHGFIGDQGKTLAALEQQHGFKQGCLDLMFIDHEKSAYLPDLLAILDRGWLHPGSVVVADNVLVPGAPAYRAYMTEQEGKRWQTHRHDTHVEYQSLIKDWVLESTLLA